uniref:Mitochondrial assembly of ribosomal large subunit protein 1 n=1 Tax=Culex pipiens TaxID=7175 RepID=A0A8D8BAT7_CULPI
MALALQHTLRRLARQSGLASVRLFHDEFSKPSPPTVKKGNPTDHAAEPRVPAAGSIANKYQVFRDIDATVILDVEEERQLQLQQNLEECTADEAEPQPGNALPSVFSGINLQRGKTGVYDIDDLVTVLRLNNAENVFVCSVSQEIKYVDYICVVTGMSFRHMRGIAEFVRKIFKMKRAPSDIIPKIEGENSRDWMALDLGNIALHIFSEQAREQYDLESLWAVGAKYDRECNKPAEPLVELFERHSVYLNDLKPLKKERTTVDGEQTMG